MYAIYIILNEIITSFSKYKLQLKTTYLTNNYVLSFIFYPNATLLSVTFQQTRWTWKAWSSHALSLLHWLNWRLAFTEIKNTPLRLQVQMSQTIKLISFRFSRIWKASNYLANNWQELKMFWSTSLICHLLLEPMKHKNCSNMRFLRSRTVYIPKS